MLRKESEQKDKICDISYLYYYYRNFQFNLLVKKKLAVNV